MEGTVWVPSPAVSSSGPNLNMPTHDPSHNGDSNHAAGGWPDNVGIVAMDIYFPAQFVEQVIFLLEKNYFICQK